MFHVKHFWGRDFFRRFALFERPVIEGVLNACPPARKRGAAAIEHVSRETLVLDGPAKTELNGSGSTQCRDVPTPGKRLMADASTMRIFAVANQKGGVGKTTTTISLGAALAERGKRVLVVDLDPQGNATTGLGVDGRKFERSVYDVLLNDVPMVDIVEPTGFNNLFVAPATLDLAGVEQELTQVISRELRLKRAISSVEGEFDYIFIDCPPSLGLITINAFAAATDIMVPVQAEFYALEGLTQLQRIVDLVQRNLNPELHITKVILTMYDSRNTLSVDVAKEVKKHFETELCRTVVPRTVRLAEAPSFGQPITVFDPTSKGAIAYRALAEEIMNG